MNVLTSLVPARAAGAALRAGRGAGAWRTRLIRSVARLLAVRRQAAWIRRMVQLSPSLKRGPLLGAGLRELTDPSVLSSPPGAEPGQRRRVATGSTAPPGVRAEASSEPRYRARRDMAHGEAGRAGRLGRRPLPSLRRSGSGPRVELPSIHRLDRRTLGRWAGIDPAAQEDGPGLPRPDPTSIRRPRRPAPLVAPAAGGAPGGAAGTWATTAARRVARALGVQSAQAAGAGHRAASEGAALEPAMDERALKPIEERMLKGMAEVLDGERASIAVLVRLDPAEERAPEADEDAGPGGAVAPPKAPPMTSDGEYGRGRVPGSLPDGETEPEGWEGQATETAGGAGRSRSWKSPPVLGPTLRETTLSSPLAALVEGRRRWRGVAQTEAEARVRTTSAREEQAPLPEDMGELARRIKRILDDEARRHGIDV
jgi:hypothetical protein